jgi:hypothetical protein
MYYSRRNLRTNETKQLWANVSCNLIVSADDVSLGTMKSQQQSAEKTASIKSETVEKVQSIKTQYAGAITVSTYSVYIGVTFITMFFGFFLLNDSIAFAKVVKEILNQKKLNNSKIRKKHEVLDDVHNRALKQTSPNGYVKVADVLNLEHQIHSKLSALKTNDSMT